MIGYQWAERGLEQDLVPATATPLSLVPLSHLPCCSSGLVRSLPFWKAPTHASAPYYPWTTQAGQVPVPGPGCRGSHITQTWLAQAVTAHVFVSLTGL